MATKQDLKVLEASLKADLIKWMVSLMVAQTGIILGLMYFIITHAGR